MKSHEELTFEIGEFINEVSGEAEESFNDVVKVKRFPLRPMTAKEASMQMDLLGHNFYVFKNAENGGINVIYRRKNGGFGLLVPEE